MVEEGISEGVIFLKLFWRDIYTELRFPIDRLNGIGIEIGEPSIPFELIYKISEQCDGVNYSVTTVWGDNSKKEYEWEGKVIGKQISHILSDYQNEVDEHDMTHFEEILEKHDLSLDKEAGPFEQFKSQGLDNYCNRCLHHHVFSSDLLAEISNYMGLNVIFNGTFDNNLCLIAEKQIIGNER